MPEVALPITTNEAGPLLVFGCGYVGMRVAKLWQQKGQPVYALTRSRADLLRQQGIIPLVGDVLEPERLPEFPSDAYVLYAIGYDRTSGHSMRAVYLDGLAHVLDRLDEPRCFVYVSSTSVYGQTDGSWVDEDSPAEPLEESGQVVRQAELLLRQRLPQAILLRSAGIYGPGRLLRRREQLLRSEPIAGDPERWLNLIHVDDLAEAVCISLSCAPTGSLYNVVDDQPISRRYYYTRLAELYQAPPPRFVTIPQAELRSQHRRISNQRIRTQLGWQPRYPSIETGLVATLAADAS